LWHSFRFFWGGGDAISGDLGDARFNSIVLEHTWLWLKGIHPSLFNLPMYHPHPNVYAYSDYLFGSAPFYWIARAAGLDVMHSFQAWLIAGMATTFVAFYFFLKKGFALGPYLAMAGAYLYAFSVVRLTHVEHAQLMTSFWIVLSAYGLLKWSRNPHDRAAIGFFGAGATLQLMTSFYFFWYWIWSLTVLLVYFVVQKQRREKLKAWLRSIDLKTLVLVGIVCFIAAAPFLIHYAMAAKEMGIRGWGSISYTLPRLYSWIALPYDHWEWCFLPF
jgi:hypothetical protein